MTTVISVRGRGRATLLADPTFVYVGRRCAGWPASIWGNPWRPEQFRGGAAECNAHYERVIAASLATFRASDDEVDCVYDRLWVLTDGLGKSEMDRLSEATKRLRELRGKQLGCWCGTWSPGGPELLCHAVVLAKLAESRP
jgi:hypothetical protein